MKGRERLSLLDGAVLRRRRSPQAVIDQFLDRLVDIFDFPVAPPSYQDCSLPASSTSRKHSTTTATDVYITMDGSISLHSRECTIGGSFNRPRKVSITDRVRELLHHSSRADSFKTTTRNTAAICRDSIKSHETSEAKELRLSWLLKKSKTALKEPQDDLWLEREEQDRQLECGYQCLADEATI